MTARLLPAALVALVLAGLLFLAGLDLSLRLAFTCAAFGYVVTACGRLLLGQDRDACAAYALGLLATCLAVYGLAVAFSIVAMAALGTFAAAVLAADIAVSRRLTARADWRALAGFVLAVALTAVWCRVPAGAYAELQGQGVLNVWSDYFFHGGLISQFGDPLAFSRGSIYLADHPSSFYHFASYAVAAALAGALDQPGLPLAMAAWLPLGFLAMLAGAHALGARLAGAVGGVAALLAVAMLPDASNYGLRNGWFSFHWTVVATPGASYAIAAALMSLLLLDRWRVERTGTALALSTLVALSMFLFRVHVFLLFIPAWIATAMFCGVPPGMGNVRLAAWLMVALLASAIASMLTVGHLADAGFGFWRFSGVALEPFLISVHSAQEPTGYTGLYAHLVDRLPPLLSLAAGVALAFAAALGAFLVALPATMAVAWRLRRLQPLDAFPGFLLYAWLLLMLFAPVPWHGDATELIHRPFVLVYAAAGVWTLCLLPRIVNMHAAAAQRLWPATLAAAVLALPGIAAIAKEMVQPKFDWGRTDASARVPPGLVEAAAFLRDHARVGDVFAVAGLTATYGPFDLSTQLCALSGVPAYLSRPYFEMVKDEARKRVVAGRLAALGEVNRLENQAHALQALQRMRVQWYVVPDGQGPRWDPGRSRAAFTGLTITLYAAHAAPGSALVRDHQ